MKFKYKFESIKRIKETLEKQIQKEIGEIDGAITRLTQEIEKTQNVQKALHMENGERKVVKVSELQHISRYEAFLDDKIAAMNAEIDELEIQKSHKIEDLKQKQKEHKIFETLEAKKYAEYMKEENRVEQLTLDEVAIQKFVRNES